MKQYDEVKLNTELNDLAERGIHKGCLGDIAEYYDKKSLVVFYNKNNCGDYAFAWVDNKYIDFESEHTAFLLEDFKKFLATHDPAKKLSFKVLTLKEYDFVELIVEKPQYTKEGIHKGMKGCIMQPYAIDDAWDVIFSDENGIDIAEIIVKEEHLKKIN